LKTSGPTSEGNLKVEGNTVGDQLIFRMPADVETAVQVRGNEILFGNQRSVARLSMGMFFPVRLSRFTNRKTILYGYKEVGLKILLGDMMWHECQH
jgi:hypothetical protein